MGITTTDSTFDVLILGAGPAGMSCALALRNSGLRVGIIDKETFPRDKICGDAIPGRAIKLLKEIHPGFETAFSDLEYKQLIRESVFYLNNKMLQHSWKLDAYSCRRLYFDNFLMSFLKEHSSTVVFENTEIREVLKSGSGWRLSTKGGSVSLVAKILIGADGINGVSRRNLTGNKTDRKHHVTALRAYYTGISDIRGSCTEFYLDKTSIPGYFWIFPLKGGLFNVGFGMISSFIAKENLNLKNEFYEVIKRSEILTQKFRNSQAAGPLEAYGIPLGSRRTVVSGDHFLLGGDAASLVDPLSGDGIGNAILSGKLAALQVVRCFTANNFSGEFMKQYNHDLSIQLWAELRKNSCFRAILTKTPLLQVLFFFAGERAGILTR